MAFLSAQPSNPQRRQHGQEPLIVAAALSEPHQDVLDASGRGMVVFPSAGPGKIREIERIELAVSGSSAQTEALVYNGAEKDQNIRDGTASGNLDFASYPRGLRIPSDVELRIVWTGGDSGAVATAKIQYVDITWVDVETGGQ